MCEQFKRTAAVVGIVVVAIGLAMAVSAEPAALSAENDGPAEPGDNVTVSYSLENTGESDSGYILDVQSIPDGWTVVEHSDDGGTWKESDTRWLYQTIEPGETKNPSVTLEIPAGESDGQYTIEGEAKDNETVRDRTSTTVTVESRSTATPTSTPISTAEPTSTPAPTTTPTSTPAPTTTPTSTPAPTATPTPSDGGGDSTATPTATPSDGGGDSTATDEGSSGSSGGESTSGGDSTSDEDAPGSESTSGGESTSGEESTSGDDSTSADDSTTEDGTDESGDETDTAGEAGDDDDDSLVGSIPEVAGMTGTTLLAVLLGIALAIILVIAGGRVVAE
jgi:hypothetical protein